MDVGHLQVASFKGISALPANSWIAFKNSDDVINFYKYSNRKISAHLESFLAKSSVNDLYLIHTDFVNYSGCSLEYYYKFYTRIVYMFTATFSLGDIYG